MRVIIDFTPESGGFSVSCLGGQLLNGLNYEAKNSDLEKVSELIFDHMISVWQDPVRMALDHKHGNIGFAKPS